MPLSEWPDDRIPSLVDEPWATFVGVRGATPAESSAREARCQQNKEETLRSWRRVTDIPNLESRHYLQAWHFLRQEGIQPPPDKSASLYGVVIEVAIPSAGVDLLDILAVYADGSARYENHSGAGVIWERPDASLDTAIATLLEAGRQVAPLVGLWDRARPPAPTGDQARVSLLTPGGLRFGQGSLEALEADPLSRVLLAAATALVTRVGGLAEEHHP